MQLSRQDSEKEHKMNNDLQTTKVDTLGYLLAQIADLTKQAEAIKGGIKEAGIDGLLEVDSEGVSFVSGAIFRATYSETNRSTFDSKKFIAKFGAAAYAEFTKTSAVFTVKVTAR